MDAQSDSKPSRGDNTALLAEIGARVRIERAKRGMTRRALAGQCQTSERYLAQIEAGAGNPSVLVLDAIARALDLDPVDLLPGGFALRSLRRLPPAQLTALMRATETRQRSANSANRAQRVALVGLRGAGKSTLGDALAERMDVNFVEIDEMIEQRHGSPVATLFEVYGQSAFRRFERDCLTEVLTNYQDVVIATPGGVVADEDTFALLLEKAHVIWLQASPAEHMRRVMEQGDFRPMEHNRHAMGDLVAILDARAPLYGRAHATVDTSGKSLEACEEELVRVAERLVGRD
jgi:XRE family aerobic/anaerobic benzoate catabolism transcriptional regulator